MKTVLNIFKSDIRAVVKNVFVLIIVLALAVLPSLYAWINIYANWDPYANAGNIEVALASRDSGIDLKNGTHVNSADEVIADVKGDKDIAYRPVDDPEEAVEGVRSGRFYAAIIFEDGFTYDMHHFEEAVGDRQPRITYYTNIKKNAVASKLTDAAADKLLEDINSQYLEKMLSRYFGDAEEVLGELDTEEAVDTALEQLTGTRDALHDYNAALSQIMAASGDVSRSLQNAQNKLDSGRSKGSADIAKAKEKINQAKSTIDDVKKTVNTQTAELKAAISELKSVLDQLKDKPEGEAKQKLVAKAIERANHLLAILQNMRAILPDDPQTTAGRVSADTMDVMISQTETIISLLQSDPSSPEIFSNIGSIKQLLDEDLKPSLKLMMTDIKKALERTEPLLKSADGVLDAVDPVLDSAGSTVNSLDGSLSGLQAMLTSLETKLDDIIKQVKAADEDNRAEVLADLLANDADQYSKYFTSVVEIEATEYYEPVSYGAAMTPFYTIIALWVGAVMLVTILNTNVNRRKFPQINEAKGFFGRYLMFFLIGQIQAAIVVAGDIFLLHCSPAHPWLMWVAAAITSMVFVMLIYALTLAFGDVGKALVIVIMMLQIAGSSGTYPIEILPDIFDKLYLFFPFPYAINAMREALCGLYGADYIRYLAELMVFCAVAIAIGIFVRKPFINIKNFMSDKMKETEVL